MASVSDSAVATDVFNGGSLVCGLRLHPCDNAAEQGDAGSDAGNQLSQQSLELVERKLSLLED
jgi:hypothetical protein